MIRSIGMERLPSRRLLVSVPAAWRRPARFRPETPIPLAPLIARYGLVAILLGAGVEGEAVVISGGVLARKGILPFWGVAGAATLGSFAVDQFWFLAGRFLRDRAWVRRLTRRSAFARALALLERHSTLFILGFRFLYGLRTASPIAIGTSRVPTRRFMALNAVSAAAWDPLMTWIGYHLGGVIGPLWQRLRYGAAVPIAVGLLLLAAALLLWWKRRPDPA
jgi:membrane protein DedA with SNARE-associated domain